MKKFSSGSRVVAERIGLAALFLFGSSAAGWAIVNELGVVGTLHQPRAVHADQNALVTLVQNGQYAKAFKTAFDLGDALFATSFNALDGAGANVGDGQRFTRIPRADLTGAGAWASHLPSRATGPNAQACTECHRTPGEDGAGPASANVVRDPNHTANLNAFIHRNTPHLFGMGGVQRLAEEMTDALQAIRRAAVTLARSQGRDITVRLAAKGIDFGLITARSDGSTDLSGVNRVDADLIVRPFQWKGIEPTIRSFNRGAAHNELGMQAVELVGDGVDGDGDGVVDEMTVGDITALAVYNAAQPRPTTRTELAALGLIPPLAPTEINAISQGGIVFRNIGCDSCHVPRLLLNDPIFRSTIRSSESRAKIRTTATPSSRGAKIR